MAETKLIVERPQGGTWKLDRWDGLFYEEPFIGVNYEVEDYQQYDLRQEDPEAYRTFADTDFRDDQQATAFVTRFGPLFEPRETRHNFTEYAREASRMRFLLDVLTHIAAKRGGVTALKRLIVWEGRDAFIRQGGLWPEDDITSDGYARVRATGYRALSLKGPAFTFVVDKIAQSIGNLRAEVDTPNPDAGALDISLRTTNLLTALYLQLALAIQKSRYHKLCAHCGKPFFPERSTGKYCSPKCNVYAHRQRRRKV